MSTVYAYTGTGRARKRGIEGLFPSIQYWPSSRVWLSTGAGLNLDAPAFYDMARRRSSPERQRDESFWLPWRETNSARTSGADVGTRPGHQDLVGAQYLRDRQAEEE